MKKVFKLHWFLLLFLSAGLIACGGETESDDNGSEENDMEVSNVSNEEEEEVVQAKPGEIPYDFPITTTNAKAGEWVLRPSRAFLDEAFKEGGDKATFIFYAGEMLEPGDVESKTKMVSEEMIPNNLIIPLGTGATAKKGDIVLTWWQSGSGMERGYVVDAGNPAEPGVKYLDISYDNPAKNKDGVPIGQMTEKLKPNSFRVLTGAWEPGTAIAVNENGDWRHYQVIRVEGDKILALGFAGKMTVVNKADAKAIPLKPEGIAKGDKVMVPYVGTYSEATVTRIDNEMGRVFVTFSWNEDEERAISFGDVIKSL